ncbi:hypothetical protein [Candidatus Nitrosocosmicus sp. R]
MPYLIGGTITASFMAHYYGFLITVIVNSIIWFVISTLVNKYYWKYTIFKEEFQLISKYTSHIKKKKSENEFNNEKDKHTEGENTNNYFSSSIKCNNQTDNLGRPLKI